MSNNPQPKQNKVLRIVLAAGIILLSVLLFFLLPAEELREMIQASGSFGPVVYILLFALLPIAFFPVPVLAVSAGLAFGFWAGSLYTLIGASINCILMFLMARYIGRDAVQKWVEKKLSPSMKRHFDRQGDKELFFLIFLSRLIPLIPYNVINYGAGLTSISFSSYLLASIIGIIPGTLVFLNLGDKSTALNSFEFAIAVILMLLLIVISTLLARYVKKRESKHDDISHHSDLK